MSLLEEILLEQEEPGAAQEEDLKLKDVPDNVRKLLRKLAISPATIKEVAKVPGSLLGNLRISIKGAVIGKDAMKRFLVRDPSFSVVAANIEKRFWIDLWFNV